MDDITRTQYSDSLQIAASKVVKQPKGETTSESWHRINQEKEANANSGVKRVAKKMVKKKDIKKMTHYFGKK